MYSKLVPRIVFLAGEDNLLLAVTLDNHRRHRCDTPLNTGCRPLHKRSQGFVARDTLECLDRREMQFHPAFPSRFQGFGCRSPARLGQFTTAVAGMLPVRQSSNKESG